MSITAWRIVKSIYADSAFTGVGSKRFPGRWNLRGDSMVYTAGSESLAVLEMLVHLNNSDKLPSYTLFRLDIPERLIEVPTQLPSGWQETEYSPLVPQFGSDWFRTSSTCILRVPSVIATSEFNDLINPLHRYFPKITVGSPQSFRFEPRLV